MNELKSYTEYAVSTPTADFVIGFDFNYGEDAVNVTVDDVPASEAGYTVVYLNETTIRLSPSVPSGVVRLQRETDIDQTDHAYRAGAKFIAQTMDENFEQIRHSQQEVRDGFVKLKGDTYAIIDTLEEVAQSAQEAADDANAAAQVANDAAAQVADKVSQSELVDALDPLYDGVNYIGRYTPLPYETAKNYAVGQRVTLSTGEIVENLVPNNNVDPNTDMLGWVKVNSAEQVFDASGASQQAVNLRTITPYTFHADGVGVNRTVSDWTVVGSKPYYQNLAAIQVDYPHVTSLTDSIDWAAFQKFLNYIKVNKCNAVAFGDFFINKPLNFLRNREPYTRVINGDITLRTTSVMPYMMRLTGLLTKWVGYINLQAEPTGVNNYDLRTVNHGLILGGFEEGYTSLGISVDEVRVHGVKQLGVFCREWSMFARIGAVRASGCGFGAKYDVTRQYADWSNRVDVGASDFNQYTTISVSVLPPELDSDSSVLIANINNEPYNVVSVDRVNNKINVFPKIDSALTTGQLYYIGGGSFGIDGANSNCARVDLLSAIASGIGCYNRSFYDLQVTRLVSESNGVGYVHGKVSNQGIVTALIGNYYNETDSWLDVLSATYVTSQSNITILTSSGLSEDRFKTMATYRLADNSLEGLYAGLGLSSVNIGTRHKEYLKLPYNKTETPTSLSLEVCDPKQNVYRKNSWTFNLTCSENNNRLYGWDSTNLEIIGTGVGNKPTGDLIFNAPSGWTVNGASSVTLNGFSTSAKITLYAYFASKQILLSSNLPLTASKTYDPPSLAANAVQSTTVTLSGAVIGMPVVCGFSVGLGGTHMWAEVTSANTVTVYHQNPTGAAVDLSSGTLTVKLI